MKKNFLASSLVVVLLASIILLQMSSCKTVIYEKTDTAYKYHPSITGLWIGTYTVDGYSNIGQQYFSVIIKPDGTMIYDTKGGNRQHLGVGLWRLSGDTLTFISTCVYGFPSNVGVVEKYTALFNQTSGTLSSGTWENYPNPTGSGTFSVTKVK